MKVAVESVARFLAVAERIFYPGKQVADADLARAWLLVLHAENVTNEEFDAAQVEVLKGSFFPKPGELTEVVARHRGERLDLAKRRYYASLVAATDASGAEVLAPYWSVGDDGRVLPPGERNPSALPPADRKAAPALPAPEDADRRMARLMRMSLPAAHQLLSLLEAGGRDVSTERAALARREARERGEAEAEQAERVRAQIRAEAAVRE